MPSDPAPISVIIPVYNRPELLREAAESVFAQSYDDFELIIVDDGSTDETPYAAEALMKSAEAAGRCRVLSLPHSGFPGAVRNRGAEAAKGLRLAFLDSDDTWLPDKLEKQLSMMNSVPGSAAGTAPRISHTREIWRRGEKTVSQKGQKHQREGWIFPDALKKCIIGPSTVMMECSLFFETGGFHETIEIAEDYEYWLRICSQYQVGYVNESLTYKRAGGWPQLSEKYGRIEWFRLCALANLLGLEIPGSPLVDASLSGEETPYLNNYHWKGFPEKEKKLALKELSFKCSVWAAGCRKRKRDAEAAQFDAIIEQIEGVSQNESGTEQDNSRNQSSGS